MTTVRSIVGVNAGTDQLNIVAHGLTTGDGFLRMYTPNGTIPAGLAPVTDFWAIRIDADHIQLADSSAHALALVPLNITSAGSGTLQLLQGLPYAVPRISAPLTQIIAADFNDTWNALVAIWNLFTGQAQSIFSGITLASGQNITLQGTADIKRTFEIPVSPAGGIYSGSASYDQTNHYATNSGAAIVTLGIGGLKVGDVIRTVDWNLFGNAGAYSSVFSLNKMTAAGAQSVVATSGTVSTPTGAAWNTHTLTVGSPVAVAAGEVWWVEWLPSSAVQRLQGANVKGDRG